MRQTAEKISEEVIAAAPLPLGVRALLWDELAERRTIEEAIAADLTSARYREIVLPIVDYVEPYGRVLPASAFRRAYRFTDRDGELVAVRSDFTPMIARTLAPQIARFELPLRLFYRGDVVRCDETRLGAGREFFQIGAELIGDANGDVEILRLAAAIAAKRGIRPVIAYGDASITTRLLGQIDESLRPAVATIVREKRLAELIDLTGRIDTKVLRLLKKIVDGSLSLLDLRSESSTRQCVESLERVAEGIRDCGDADFVLSLDDIEPDGSYYSGLRFRLFARRSNREIGAGGRYDNLYAAFGADVRAIGFTLNLDALLEAR